MAGPRDGIASTGSARQLILLGAGLFITACIVLLITSGGRNDKQYELSDAPASAGEAICLSVCMWLAARPCLRVIKALIAMRISLVGKCIDPLFHHSATNLGRRSRYLRVLINAARL